MKIRWLPLLVWLIAFLIILPLGCSIQPTLTKTPSPTPVLVPQNQNLVNATITVRNGGHYDVPFSVDTSKMRDIKVSGTFRAYGGFGNDIIALIMDDMAYINWANGHKVSIMYSSGQLTTANINVPITSSGKYHLVFDNNFSILSSKDVSTKIELLWSELKYQ